MIRPQSQLAAQIELKNVERNVQIYRSIDIKKAGHNPERVPKMYESFYGRHHASKSASKENPICYSGTKFLCLHT